MPQRQTFVLAPDSFKESMSAKAAARAMASGIRRVLPDARCIELPVSDGGEGFTDAIATSLHADICQDKVANALGQTREATWAYDPTQQLAIIECAEACGLEHIEPGNRDIMRANTAGLGTLITAALDRGAKRFVIGLGGSATNDLGAGMLHTLGARFFDEDESELPPIPADLSNVAHVDFDGLDPRLKETHIEVACDVNNPLLGSDGCAAVFGSQKGAGETQVRALDKMAKRIAQATDTLQASETPGCGAAGGLGWAFHLILGAKLMPGIDLVLDTVKLADALEQADLVFTGEGAMDRQTLSGKTPHGVVLAAKRAGVPCLAFAGHVGEGVEELLEHFHAVIPINRSIGTLEDALGGGAENLAAASELAARIYCLGRGLLVNQK